MKLRLYWSYATRSLMRGGQRTVLALFCVAVGVLAIVALQLVGLSVNSALLGNIIDANGGDIRVNADIAPLRQADLAVFDRLKQQERITNYATSYDPGGSITLPSGGEESFSFIAVSPNFPLVGQADFLAPSSNLTLQSVVQGNSVVMSSSVYTDLGAHIGSRYMVKTLDGRLVPIVVAAEIQEDGVFRGPQIIVSRSLLDSIPGPTGVREPAQYSTVYMTVPVSNISSVKNQLGQQFPSARIITANDLLSQRQKQVDQIRLFLRIVGLLALFIGGIGIINTIQVLLRRRQIEIAMLKTTGYRQRDLYILFGLETALLGILGGLLGTLAGLGASFLVRTVVERAFFIHLPIVLDSLTIFTGPLIGLATALIFGLLPIVQASQIRPLSVLRELIETRRISSRLITAFLLFLLSLLFVALATSILGDLVTAVIAVYGGAGLIFALALGFGLLVLAISKLPVYEKPRLRMLLWIAFAFGLAILSLFLLAGLFLLGQVIDTFVSNAGASLLGTYMLIVLAGIGIILVGGAFVYLFAMLVNSLVLFMPRSWKTSVMLAYRNLGRQRVRTTTTLTALFVGVFAIGLILVLGQGLKDTVNSALSSLFTHNVFVVVAPPQKATVNRQLAGLQGVDASKTQVNPVVPQIYPLLVNGRDINSILRSVSRRDKISRQDIEGDLTNIEGFDLSGGQQNIPTIILRSGRNLTVKDAGTNAVILNEALELPPVNLRVGQTIVVQSQDGTITRVLRVVGFYDGSTPNGNPNFAGMLADSQIVEQLGGHVTLEVFSLKVDPDHVPALRRALIKAVPSAIILSVVDIDTFVNQILNNLIIMLTTIASLAMIAGLIIIANAVALAMLERRREIGILKSVGHTSRSILATVLIENGLVGLLGSLVAAFLVVGAIVALSQFVFQTGIAISPVLVALVIVCTSLLTMLVAALVAWRAVRVRPLDVLRYE
ncbi:MAG TPA: FtsX-like permease family protein [Ktedonobacteraceae bacterium]|jgi:predicted lysophospholipase L1 biosynthesis ABC-type transport system permease subunit|nr:FtsX-like permease family protein [Ktedonobacteraceae bacterium]